MEQSNNHAGFLGRMLHLADPVLPIGGYTHSNGQETYVQMSLVSNAESAKVFTCNMLQYNIKYNDAAFVRFAYQAAQDGDLAGIYELDNECSALKAPRELREASLKLGLRLSKIFSRRFKNELLDAFLDAVSRGAAQGNYSIFYGLYAQAMNIPLPDALFAFYYNTAVSMVTTSVKLVPLGQLQGQDIMFDLQDLFPRLVEETLSLDPELRGLCCMGFDIRAMQHERLYSRLYMS